MHGNQPFFCGNTLSRLWDFVFIMFVRCFIVHDFMNEHRTNTAWWRKFSSQPAAEQINKNRRVRSCSFAKRLFVYANRRHCIRLHSMQLGTFSETALWCRAERRGARLAVRPARARKEASCSNPCQPSALPYIHTTHAPSGRSVHHRESNLL